MTIGCYPNKEYKFQINSFITKHYSNLEQVKNISMIMHSYAAFVFESENIMVKQPLEKMREIIIGETEVKVINPKSTYEKQSDYEKLHEEFIKCPQNEIDYFGISLHEETLIIKITEEFKLIHKNTDGLEFNCTKVV
uniref:Uncharacterized protein n=1 Tax=viral metagenome TaxID=1070528 RepID=A0A6C0AD82_9ZZZZ